MPTAKNTHPATNLPGSGFPPLETASLIQTSTGPKRVTGRSWRVAILVAMIALVSVADLYLTLFYLHNGGMAEGNPIARWVMRYGNPWTLGLFKVVLVGFTCTVLWKFRERRTTEVAAWICCIAMGLLCFQWRHYTEHVAEAVMNQPEITDASVWVEYGN